MQRIELEQRGNCGNYQLGFQGFSHRPIVITNKHKLWDYLYPVIEKFIDEKTSIHTIILHESEFDEYCFITTTSTRKGMIEITNYALDDEDKSYIIYALLSINKEKIDKMKRKRKVLKKRIEENLCGF